MHKLITPTEVGQLDWTAHCRLEPKLIVLLFRVHAIPCRFHTWRRWESVKATMQKLVGWKVRRPELRTTEAYDAAYRKLLDAWEGRL